MTDNDVVPDFVTCWVCPECDGLHVGISRIVVLGPLLDLFGRFEVRPDDLPNFLLEEIEGAVEQHEVFHGILPAEVR